MKITTRFNPKQIDNVLNHIRDTGASPTQVGGYTILKFSIRCTEAMAYKFKDLAAKAFESVAAAVATTVTTLPTATILTSGFAVESALAALAPSGCVE